MEDSDIFTPTDLQYVNGIAYSKFPLIDLKAESANKGEAICL